MSATFIVTTPRANYNALKHQGILVTERFAQIKSTLERNLSPGHAAIFAQPFHTASGDDIDWYSQAAGPVSQLKQLPENFQQKVKAELARVAEDINVLAEQLINSPDAASVTRGHILKLALNYPSYDNVYLVGQQPVITCWGFVPAAASVLPQDLSRQGSARPEQTAGAQAIVEDHGQTGPQAPGNTPAPQPPDPGQPAASHTQTSHRKTIFVFPPWLRQLLWLLLALAITLLVLGLTSHIPGCAGLNNFGCAPPPVAQQEETNPAEPPPTATPPVETANEADAPSNEPSPELAEAVKREGEYRQRLEELRRQLIARAAQCTQETPPEQRPDIENHLPRTEEPQIKPEQKPEPETKPEQQPEPTPEEKPEIKPEEKPQEQPEEKPEEKPEPEPRPERDAPMEIPPEAAENNDLSFLEGCWINTTNLYNMETKEQINARYCFDKNGNGSRVVVEPDGTRCAGSARARFDSSGKLIIQSDSASCNRNDSGGYVPQRIECRGSASQTNCSGKEQTPQAHEWSANFRRQ